MPEAQNYVSHIMLLFVDYVHVVRTKKHRFTFFPYNIHLKCAQCFFIDIVKLLNITNRAVLWQYPGATGY